MPVTWVAWAMVPSTPARMLYRAFHGALAWAARAAVTASWMCRGRRCRVRPVAEVVHWSRAGQVRQAALGNLTVMTSWPALLACSHQVALAWPWGQVTWRWSQSMANMSGAYPPVRAWRVGVVSSGAIRVIPRAAAVTSWSAEAYPASSACSAGASPAVSRMSWMGPVISASVTVAVVVATAVIRFGAARLRSGAGW